MSDPKYTFAEGEYSIPLYLLPNLTCFKGQPIRDPSVSTTFPVFGGGGITTLGDTLLLETLAHFNRERIPER